MSPRPDQLAGWSSLLRAATLRDAASVAREARSLPGPLGRFVEGVATVLAGSPDDGQALLLRAAADPEASLVVEFAATATAALAVLWGASVVIEPSVVEERAEALGAPWAQRLGAAVQALLSPGALPEQSVRPFDVEADDWGGALCALHLGLASRRDGASAVVVLDEAVSRLGFLGADLLEVHARAALAHALAVEGQPEALQTARQAADDARRLGAHGAAVRAKLAAAVAEPADAEIWVQRTRRSAAAFGLPEPVAPVPPAAPAPRAHHGAGGQRDHGAPHDSGAIGGARHHAAAGGGAAGLWDPALADLPPPLARARPGGPGHDRHGRRLRPSAAVILRWRPGIGQWTVTAGGDGSFRTQVLVLPDDVEGPRLLEAVGAAGLGQLPGGTRVGAARLWRRLPQGLTAASGGDGSAGTAGGGGAKTAVR